MSCSYRTPELLDRFWSKVNKTTTCWLWTGGKNNKGYGLFGINRKTHLSHRVSYELLHDLELTPDVCVCHSCDTPLCINPFHLFAGTNQDNINDKVSKGRQQCLKGELHGASILTNAIVQNIKQDLKSDTTHGSGKKIAEKYGISRSTVSDIKKGKTWSHILLPQQM
jgi:predicted XRE-type DNA-binding protein